MATHRPSTRSKAAARRRHIEPAGWLGAGAITIGVGAALIGAAGSAHADTTTGGATKPAGNATSGAAHNLSGHASHAVPGLRKFSTAASSTPTPHQLLRAATAKQSARVTASASPLDDLGREIQYTFFNRSPVAAPTQLSESTTGVVTGNLQASNPAGNPMSYSVTTAPAEGTVAVASDGTYTFTPNAALAASGGSDSFAVAVDDGKGVQLPGLAGVLQSILHLGATLIGLSQPDTIQSAVQVTVTPVVPAGVDTPVAGPPGPQTVDSDTGVVTGTLGFTDPAGAPLTYTVTTNPVSGSVSAATDGTYTYTPTDAARLAAAADPNAETDSFTVSASNGLASAVTTIHTPITPLAQAGSSNTIHIAGGPFGVAVSPDGAHVYVTDHDNGTVSVIDTATKSVTATITVGANPEDVAFSPNGATAYVTNFGDNTVSIINVASNTVTKTINVDAGPENVVASPDGAHVYVVNYSGDTISAIDTASGTVTSAIPAEGYPAGIAISPDNSTLYVANFEGNSILVTGTSAGSPSHLIIIDGASSNALPNSLALSPDGSRLYIDEYGHNIINVVNTATGDSIATYATGSDPTSVVISPDGKYLYVGNVGGNSDGNAVDVISTATGTKVNGVAVGNSSGLASTALAISPDGKTLYVANFADGIVTIVPNPNG
jgi:YVTN family beta-propeller protein